jgi:radical SAM protein with 4Fe4S-binding SPASM domain
MLETLKNSLVSAFKRLKTGSDLQPQTGLYHYLRQTEEEKTRLHLRIDPDGHGTLLINANQIIHLNPTAAHMAYLALEEIPTPAAVQSIQDRFQVSSKEAEDDYRGFHQNLEALIRDQDCLVCAVPDLEVEAPFSVRPQAPYRMDLALTYRCNNDCPHCYNARARSFSEMETEQWYQVIDQLWESGIPHVVFTGGEPTLRDDLPDLIAYAEGKGQITGLNTNGRRLQDPAYLQALVDAGLDHVQITFESHDPDIHNRMVKTPNAWSQTRQGIENAVQSSLYVMTNTTMLEDNYRGMDQTLTFLAELGVPTIGLNALIYSGRGADVGTGLSETELKPLLEIAKKITGENQQRLIWYTPTQYCHFDPVQLDLGVKGCSAALYNMCVEPNGDVLPCQSYYSPLGNILTDPWESIWAHDLAVEIRERKYIPEECELCPLLPECGGGCPLALKEKQFTPEQIIPLHH